MEAAGWHAALWGSNIACFPRSIVLFRQLGQPCASECAFSPTRPYWYRPSPVPSPLYAGLGCMLAVRQGALP